MIEIVVDDEKLTLLVGGGQHRRRGTEMALRHAGRTVAADSGADWLVARGYRPDVVIGDMDSIAAETRAALEPEQLCFVAEQDSTDFEKCLARINSPLVLGVGFTGGRADHELAAYHALMAFSHRRCVLLGKEDVVCLAPPRLRLELEQGTRVSLFPMGAVRVRSTGLRWDTDGIKFAPGQRIGTSNQSVGPVELVADAPAMLLILPLAQLETLLTGLLAGPAWAC